MDIIFDTWHRPILKTYLRGTLRLLSLATLGNVLSSLRIGSVLLKKSSVMFFMISLERKNYYVLHNPFVAVIVVVVVIFSFIIVTITI